MTMLNDITDSEGQQINIHGPKYSKAEHLGREGVPRRKAKAFVGTVRSQGNNTLNPKLEILNS